MRSMLKFGCTAAAIVLQAILVSILVSRITCSKLNSIAHSHLSFYSRLKLVSVTTYLLWASFVTGWIYTVMAILVHAGLDIPKHQACTITFFSCAYFYALAKLPIYLFLIERALVVRGLGRTRDRMYLINLLVLGLFGVIFAFPPQHRLVQIRGGKCYIGVTKVVSIPVIVYDVVVNLFWYLQFLLPIVRNARRRRSACSRETIFMDDSWLNLAYRTAWATLGTCAISTCNIVTQIILNGKEESYVLLLTCSLDVACSCVILHLTAQRPKNDVYGGPRKVSELDPKQFHVTTMQTFELAKTETGSDGLE